MTDQLGCGSLTEGAVSPPAASPGTSHPEIDVAGIHIAWNPDEATRADMAVALQKLKIEIDVRTRAEAQLRKYERIVATSHDLMSLIDRDYVYQAVNDAYLEAHGRRREDLVGHAIPDVMGAAVFEKTIKDRLDRCFAGEEIHYDAWFDYVGLGRKFMHVTYYPFLGRDGEASGVVVNCRDMTQTRQLESQLAQATKMEAVGRLAGGVAHDFNNVLSAIMGYVELAQLTIPEENPATSRLTEVLKATSRAADLVKQLLAFSRHREQQPEPLQLGCIVKETLKLIRATTPSTIEIRQTADESASLVLADPTQMHQLLMNLCTNAVDAMRNEGGRLHVMVDDFDLDGDLCAEMPDLAPGPYVRLTVSDTGCGIEENVRARMFDPFFTTKEPGRGIGMGLAVVHGVVQNHGGAVSVESKVGNGARVRVLLPRTEGAVQPEPVAEAPLPGEGERILFVDDEKALAHLGKELLEHLGYRVDSFSSSLEALNAFHADPDGFDLVVTDQTMPHMTGQMLAREMLQTRPDLRIILCTGYSELINEEQAREMGIHRLVMKPVDMQSLAQTIRDVLGT